MNVFKLVKPLDQGSIGHTPIFLSFHSTVSCRSDISLTKPSCFIRSWRISYTAGQGKHSWKKRRKEVQILCEKKWKLWNAWQHAAVLSDKRFWKFFWFHFNLGEDPCVFTVPHTHSGRQILTFSSSSLCFSVSFISLNWNWSTLWACFSRSCSCGEQETAWQLITRHSLWNNSYIHDRLSNDLCGR